MQTFNLDLASAKEFLEVYKGESDLWLPATMHMSCLQPLKLCGVGCGRAVTGVVPEYLDLAEELTEGPLLAMEVRAEKAVETFRETVGPWDIEMAKELRPATIRALFGKDRIRNAVHCTDLPEDGELECRYFFSLQIAAQTS